MSGRGFGPASRGNVRAMSAPRNGGVEERVVEALDAVAEAARNLGRAGREYLASEQGRRLRRGLATAMIVGAPLAGELPVIRRTALGRVLRFAGATALVVKGAEWLRDWDPTPPIAS